MDTRLRLLTAAAACAVIVPVLSACSDDSASTAPTDTTDTTVSQSTVSQSAAAPSAVNGEHVDLATTPVAIGWRQALDIAGRQFAGKPVSIKLEVKPAAAPQYQITFVSDTQEAEVDIDADIGEVVGKNIDPIERDVLADKGEPLTFDGLIEPDVAMSTAVKALPGPVTEWKLKRQKDRIVYVVDVKNPQDDGDVTLDAKTGAVIEVDR